MSIFLDKRKVKAAVSSIHQFHPAVRALFRDHVDDEIVEAITIFLYLRVAELVFGRGFVERMDETLPVKLKYSDPGEIQGRLTRIGRHSDLFLDGPDDLLPHGTTVTDFEKQVRSIMRALLLEAGHDHNDAEQVREMFVPFEKLIKGLDHHLRGIKRQNHFVMTK